MRVLVVAAIAAFIGGGAVYGVLLYLGQNPVQMSVQLRQETPSLAPALRLSATAAPTVPPTATLRPTPTVTSEGISLLRLAISIADLSVAAQWIPTRV